MMNDKTEGPIKRYYQKMKFQSLNIISCLLMLVLISSCATLEIPNDFNSMIQEDNLTTLEGTYKNIAINSNSPFWERFSSVDIRKHKETINDTSSVFKLQIDPNNKIRFELYLAGKLEMTETFNYSYHQKGLAIKGRSNYRYEGIPLIFYRSESQALWLSKDNEQELFVSFNGSATGGIFILIFGTPINGEARFMKIAK